ALRHAPEGAHRRAAPARAAVQGDRRLRALRPERVLLGEDEPRRPDGRGSPRRQDEGHERRQRPLEEKGQEEGQEEGQGPRRRGVVSAAYPHCTSHVTLST